MTESRADKIEAGTLSAPRLPFVAPLLHVQQSLTQRHSQGRTTLGAASRDALAHYEPVSH